MLNQNKVKYEKLLAKSIPEIRKFIPSLIEEIEESLHCFIQKARTIENNGYAKCDDEHDMFKGMCPLKILSSIYEDYNFINSYCELIKAHPNIINEFDSNLLNRETMKFDKISMSAIKIVNLLCDLIDIDKEKDADLSDYE